MSKRERIVTVTLTVRIHDVRAFRAAAKAHALAEGLSTSEAISYIRSKTLAECAQMLLDPGMGPEGSDILDGSAEELYERAHLRNL